MRTARPNASVAACDFFSIQLITPHTNAMSTPAVSTVMPIARASGFLGWHPVDATKSTAAGTIGEFATLIGVNYSLDVIRLVPSFDVQFGLLGIRGDAAFHDNARSNAVVSSSTAFGVGLGFSLD